MPTSTRTFSIPTSTTSALTLQIHDDLNIRAENLHLETWGSSLVLARRLHALPAPRPSPGQPSPQPAARILELGAGTGLVGIAAAAVWGTHVTLTDLPPIVPALQANIELNADLLAAAGGGASSAALDWRRPSVITPHGAAASDTGPELALQVPESGQASVILAADTIYDPAHPEMLVGVVETWLRRGPESTFLVAYPVRVAYLEEIRELWERLQGAGMVAVEEGKEELPKKDWDDETLIEWSVWKWK